MWKYYLLPCLFASSLLTAGTASVLSSNIQWEHPIIISPELSNSGNVQLAVNSLGELIAVWPGFNGSHYVIYASECEFGRTWTEPKVISNAHYDSSFANIAADSLGNAIAVWSTYEGNNVYVQSAFYDVNLGWKECIDLTKAELKHASAYATLPQIVFDTQNNATVVWQTQSESSSIIQSASKKHLSNFNPTASDKYKLGHFWAAPTSITLPSSTGVGDLTPKIVVDKSGNALAIWKNDGNSTIRSATKPFNKPWSEAVEISDSDQRVDQPQVVIDAFGNATAMWIRNDGSNDIVQTSSKTLSGNWTAPHNLSTAGFDSYGNQLAVDSNGNVTAVWQESNGAYTIITSAAKLVNHMWQPSESLSADGQDASEPQLKIAKNNTIAMVWKRSDGQNFVIESLVKPLNSAWGTPAVLSASGEDAISPQLGIDNDGNVTVAWQKADGKYTVVQTAIGINQQ